MQASSSSSAREQSLLEDGLLSIYTHSTASEGFTGEETSSCGCSKLVIPQWKKPSTVLQDQLKKHKYSFMVILRSNRLICFS